MSGQRITFEKDLAVLLSKLNPNIDIERQSFDIQKSNEELIRQFLEPNRHSAQTDIDQTLERILYASIIISQADSGFISLRNLKNKIEFKLGRNKIGRELGVKDFVIERALIRQSIQKEQSIHINFNRAQHDLHPAVCKQNLLVAPMFLYSDFIGLVYLTSYQPIISAESVKAQAFHVFLKHAGIAIRNFQYNKLRDDFEAEREALHKSLIESDNMAMKGRMAAKIGHEINNFLSGINANIEMAADLVETRGKKVHIIERLQKAQEMIMNLAQMSNSLMSKNGMEANVEKSSLNQVVEKFVDFVKPIYKSSNVVLDKELERMLPAVEIDSGMMIQVLFNIVKNAVEAKPDARILLKTYYEKKNRRVFLEIHDNGPGIPQDKQHKIFKPQFTHNKSNGHGYGLAICRDIVEKHDGEIAVNSNPAEGTTFVISLPFKVGDDYAQVEFDSLESLEVKRARSLKNSIKAKRKRTITNAPYRPIIKYSKMYGLK